MIKSETGLCRVAGVGVSGASDFSGSESSGSFEAVDIPLGILDAREVWEEPLRDDEEMKVLSSTWGVSGACGRVLSETEKRQHLVRRLSCS